MSQPSISATSLAARMSGLDQLGETLFESLVYPWTWRHRKVETIALLAGSNGRRRVSIDCTPPEILLPDNSGVTKQAIIPLTLLRKEQLRGFDLTDDRGRAMPLLGRADNGTLSAAALKFDLETQCARPLTSDEWDLCVDVATLDSSNAAIAARELEKSLAIAGLAASGLLARLQCSFVLMAVCQPEDTGRRQIVKFSYHWKSADGSSARLGPMYRHALVGLGIGSTDFVVDVDEVSAAASYHLEIPLPSGMLCSEIILADFEPTTALLDPSVAHINVTGIESYIPSTKATVKVRIDTSGLHTSVSYMAFTTSVALWATRFSPNALHTVGATAGPAATLLIFGQALFIALLLRTEENAFSQRLFGSLRLCGWMLSGLLFGAAVTLVGALRDPWLGRYWLAGAVISTALFALLFATGQSAGRALIQRSDKP